MLKQIKVLIAFVAVSTLAATAQNTYPFPSSGNVGIGTTNPQTYLELMDNGSGTAEATYKGTIQVQSGADLETGTNGLEFKASAYGLGFGWKILSPDRGDGNTPLSFAYRANSATWTELLTMRTDNGNVGIGTTTPGSLLDIARGGFGISIGTDTGGATDDVGFNREVTNGTIFNTTGYAYQFQHAYSTTAASDSLALQVYNPSGAAVTGNAFAVTGAGNVGIGTISPTVPLEVYGSIKITPTSGGSITYADGTTQGTAWTGTLTGGDYAESMDVTGSRDEYEPGDVLVIDHTHSERVLKSSEPYSLAVAGVYSTKPGVVGRRQKIAKELATTEVPMAMVGVVPTKVSAENGPIQPGDVLVTSSTPGYAMKGTDRSLLAGAVIGKALESLDSGAGVIEAVISLQ